jgi:molybdopterin converting factor small subunit
MTTIRIPTPLRAYAGGQANVTVTGDTVQAALADLTTQYPDLQNHLFDGATLRSFVNLYVNKEDIRHLQGLDTAVVPTDTLMIVPSIAGGTPIHP